MPLYVLKFSWHYSPGNISASSQVSGFAETKKPQKWKVTVEKWRKRQSQTALQKTLIFQKDPEYFQHTCTATQWYTLFNLWCKTCPLLLLHTNQTVTTGSTAPPRVFASPKMMMPWTCSCFWPLCVPPRLSTPQQSGQ